MDPTSSGGSDTPSHSAGPGGGQDGDTNALPSLAEKLQRRAIFITIAGALLTFAAAIDRSPFPHGTPELAWALHPILLVVGLAGGLLTIVRHREIDAERWRVVSDDALTSGERSWAHKEAEQQMRSAGTAFLMAGAALGAWLAYQTRVPMTITAAELLVATPVLGFGAGLFFGNRRFPKTPPPV